MSQMHNNYEQAIRHGLRLETVLDNLSTLIHVTRPETGEILFINRAMRESEDFTLRDLDLTTATCWQALGEDLGRICDCCPYERLKHAPGETYEWDTQDPMTGRAYHNTSFLVEWDDGTQVYMCETTDVTEIHQLFSAMERQVAQQRLQAQVILKTSQQTHMEAVMPEVLPATADFLGAERAFLLRVDGQTAPFLLADEWCAPGFPSLTPSLRDLPLDDLRDAFSPRQSQSTLLFDNVEVLPEELLPFWRDGGLHSLLVLPIRVESELWGMLCYAVSHELAWNEQDFAMLHTICGILASAVRRIRAEQRRDEAQHQLEEAIVAAKNASGAKSDFLSRMSHEIRTPMNVIIGMCRIALRAEDPNKVKHSLNQIDTSAKHLLSLINDILDVSKIEANKFELHMEPLDLEHVLRSVSDIVMVRAEEKRQTIQILLSKGMPRRFVGDSMRLAQVFTNLFTNAIKFSPDGGNIVLSMQELGRKGNISTLEARVRDHGIGMSSDQLARLFTSFEQVDGGIARKYGGTGLGLAICKSIVGMMNGTIRAESEPGKGSTFIFTIELEVGSAADEDQPEGILPPNLRVMIIDDEPETCAHFTDIMTSLGIACDQANSGAQALEMLQHGLPYNIIFVDWRMPDMDGLETSRRIQALTDIHANMVMISGADPTDIREEAAQAGVLHFIAKPLFPSDLFNMIVSVLHLDSGRHMDQAGSLSDTPDLHGHRVLLVEDMEFNREVARSMLEETGCGVEEVENGVQAVALFGRDPTRFGCILMDMQMPVMDGLEATRAIREMPHPWAQKVPIIAMTANVFQDDVERCLAAGMDDHIGKPIADHTLYEKLAFYLHANAGPLAAQESQEPAVPDTAENFLPYVLVEEGLVRLRGNRKLFATLLGSFQRNTKYDELREQIAQGSFHLAAQAAHALKGIAANIELEEVLRLVVEVEAILKTGIAPSEELLVQLEYAYRATMTLLPRAIHLLMPDLAR